MALWEKPKMASRACPYGIAQDDDPVLSHSHPGQI